MQRGKYAAQSNNAVSLFVPLCSLQHAANHLIAETITFLQKFTQVSKCILPGSSKVLVQLFFFPISQIVNRSSCITRSDRVIDVPPLGERYGPHSHPGWLIFRQRWAPF